jgi:hypothetical protein
MLILSCNQAEERNRDMKKKNIGSTLDSFLR